MGVASQETSDKSVNILMSLIHLGYENIFLPRYILLLFLDGTMGLPSFLLHRDSSSP